MVISNFDSYRPPECLMGNPAPVSTAPAVTPATRKRGRRITRWRQKTKVNIDGE
jgi:hypothetical protein